jgi:hypothetical protein
MMTFFKFFLILPWQILNSCAAQKEGHMNYGTQRVAIFLGSANDTILPPFGHVSELLYYGDYMIEPVFMETYTDAPGKQVSSSTDTSYYFIDFKRKICVSYDKISLDAAKGASFSLKDKCRGLDFGKAPNTSKKRSKPVFVKDTLMNGVTCKILSAYILLPNDKEEITYYVDSSIREKLLFHINKIEIGNEFQGTVIRKDNYTPGTTELSSVRMTVRPGELSAYQLAVFRSWINSNK